MSSIGFLYHGITYLSASGALRNLYNPACSYTHLQHNLADLLVSVTDLYSQLAFSAASVYGFSVNVLLWEHQLESLPSQLLTKLYTL